MAPDGLRLRDAGIMVDHRPARSGILGQIGGAVADRRRPGDDAEQHDQRQPRRSDQPQRRPPVLPAPPAPYQQQRAADEREQHRAAAAGQRAQDERHRASRQRRAAQRRRLRLGREREPAGEQRQRGEDDPRRIGIADRAAVAGGAGAVVQPVERIRRRPQQIDEPGERQHPHQPARRTVTIGEQACDDQQQRRRQRLGEREGEAVGGRIDRHRQRAGEAGGEQAGQRRPQQCRGEQHERPARARPEARLRRRQREHRDRQRGIGAGGERARHALIGAPGEPLRDEQPGERRRRPAEPLPRRPAACRRLQRRRMIGHRPLLPPRLPRFPRLACPRRSSRGGGHSAHGE
ncbi:hypothetical protein BW41_01204 [Sphingomonas sp. RIT328]|nr:hypothetical protein BW41_01204 [Sphingomonas sp. RIT328]